MPYGINELTLTHTLSGAQQLRLLRMMLVKEEGSDLWLAFATPRAWLQGSKIISVKKAPTRYGLRSYSLGSDIKKRQAKAVVEPLPAPSGRYPSQVRLRLRVPKSLGKLRAVTVNGNNWHSFEDDQIQLEGSLLKQQTAIVANFSGS